MSAKATKISKRQLLVLRRLPCRAISIPRGYRVELPVLEKAGLIVYGTYHGLLDTWSLTDAGRAALACCPKVRS